MKKLLTLFTAITAIYQGSAVASTQCAKGTIQEIVVGLDDDILANGSYANTDGPNSVTLKINGIFYRLDNILNLNDLQGGPVLAAAISAAAGQLTVELYDQYGGATCDDWQEILVHRK